MGRQLSTDVVEQYRRCSLRLRSTLTISIEVVMREYLAISNRPVSALSLIDVEKCCICARPNASSHPANRSDPALAAALNYILDFPQFPAPPIPGTILGRIHAAQPQLLLGTQRSFIPVLRIPHFHLLHAMPRVCRFARWEAASTADSW